jgi:hypothetical protein
MNALLLPIAFVGIFTFVAGIVNLFRLTWHEAKRVQQKSNARSASHEFAGF